MMKLDCHLHAQLHIWAAGARCVLTAECRLGKAHPTTLESSEWGSRKDPDKNGLLETQFNLRRHLDICIGVRSSIMQSPPDVLYHTIVHAF
jgi:hypothetical protein